MSSENWSPTRRRMKSFLQTYIAERVIGRASGRLEQECLFKMPQDCYFIGNLRSAVDKKDAANE